MIRIPAVGRRCAGEFQDDAGIHVQAIRPVYTIGAAWAAESFFKAGRLIFYAK